MLTSNTLKCGRCLGTGCLSFHSNVLGGVCFRCNGTGIQKTKPRKPTPKWAVFGLHKATGQLLRLYNVTASTKAKAIETARATYASASKDWQATYTLTTADALKWVDMTNQQALTWAEATA